MPAVSGNSRRAWGWHPLSDSWAARIVADAQIRPGDLVLDIGAGRGAITTHLVRAGARVLAIELHPGRASHLRQRFANDPVTVLEIDVGDLLLPRRAFRVVANPPYGVSTALLRRLLSPASKLVTADLVLQRAFARRAAGQWRTATWRMELGTNLPRSAFQPPPQVDSAVLVVRRMFRP